jgi:ribosomal protein S18 acetylase RimI-like enzyme
MNRNTDYNQWQYSNRCNQDDINYLWEGINEYNRTIGPMSNYSMYEPYRIVIRNSDNVIIAGILTKIYLNSMHVELLWIAPQYRKSGLGTELLTKAELYAKENGCTFICLDTFSFQAIHFYIKYGYEVYATLDDFPDDIVQYYLRKKF